MGFFGFGTSAPAAPEENVIPEEEQLLVALRTAYRDPNITTTKAMHLVPRPPLLAPRCLNPFQTVCSCLPAGVADPACLHQDVLARHPNWTVNLKRVRKLLCKVVSPPKGEQADDASSRRTWTEEEVEDWCIITASTPAIAASAAVPQAASSKVPVSASSQARRRGRS